MTGDGSTGPVRPQAPRRLTIFLVANGVLLAILVGGLLWMLNQPLRPSTEYGQTFSGDALLKDEAARRGLPVGQGAPGFSVAAGDKLELVALNGDRVSLSDYLGRPVWIVFWATYCHACQLEEPDLRRAFDAYRAEGLALVAIDIGEDAATVRRYAGDRGLPWTILLDASGTAVDRFGAIGTPSHYFIGADGRIQSRAFGRLRYAEMDARLRALLGPASSAPGAASR
ncbi:MAG: TlpA family protein disulfide reductase [Chloroflexi bacterium]|nr:TlpA family protein disulfide reductase [Chloroflexota bacterium]